MHLLHSNVATSETRISFSLIYLTMPRPWLARLSISCCRAASAVCFDRNGCPASITETKNIFDKFKIRTCEHLHDIATWISGWRTSLTTELRREVYHLILANLGDEKKACPSSVSPIESLQQQKGQWIMTTTKGKARHHCSCHRDRNFLPLHHNSSKISRNFAFLWGQHSPCSTAMSSPRDGSYVWTMTRLN